MFKKFSTLLLLICLILTSFYGCKTKGVNAQIVLPVDLEPQYLDPQIISDSGAELVMQNCLEGLVRYNSNGEIVCAASESYNISQDGLTYTFNLRKDGVWRVTTASSEVLGEDYEKTFDTRVTADDFAFAIERALQPETLCPYAGLLMNIKNAKSVFDGKKDSSSLGVKAVDEFTLQISLERPDGDFLAALATPACLPCNRVYFEKTGGRYGLSNAYLIYNGPFYLANWSEHTAISLRRNDFYHGIGSDNIENEVMPKSIYISFNSEIATRPQKLSDKKYMLAPLTSFQANELAEEKRVSVKSFDSSLQMIIFNCGDELLSNTNLRKAMLAGLDYSIFSNSLADGMIPDGLLFDGERIDNRDNIKKAKYDVTQAGKLYKKALKDLEKKNVSLTFLCPESEETLGRTIIQSWQSAFGVTFGIEVESVSDEEFQKRIADGEYQLALYDINYRTAISKIALDCFKSDDRHNITQYHSKTLDKLINEIYVSSGKNELNALVEAENFIIEKAVVIPVCRKQFSVGLNSKSSQAAFSPDGHTIYFKDFLCA